MCVSVCVPLKQVVLVKQLGTTSARSSQSCTESGLLTLHSQEFQPRVQLIDDEWGEFSVNAHTNITSMQCLSSSHEICPTVFLPLREEIVVFVSFHG